MTDVTCCEKCCKPLDDHPLIDVSNVKVLQMCDRHPKWQRVEPGTVIPAGQPYARSYSAVTSGCVWEEFVWAGNITVGKGEWFIDSSWKPPLVLPTEPTWGIAVHDDLGLIVGQWYEDGAFLTDDDGKQLRRERIISFTTLTDEQVARIEAAR